MKRFVFCMVLLAAIPVILYSQKVTYSDFEQEDNRDINFEIIGKMKGDILVYKNVRKWIHKINVLGDDMKIKQTVRLDFMPEKTFNVDFVVYPDYFWMIYQFQKKNILHCMAVKLDAAAQKMGDPVEIDTTQIPFLADNKIYTTIHSEDKQRIMVFKMPKKNDQYSLVTMLFNSDMKLTREKSRQPIDLDERRDTYSNFFVDNEGTLVFTKDSKTGLRDNSNLLQLMIKDPQRDTFSTHDLKLDKNYIDEVKLKVDNLNKRYILNSFYYKKSRGNIDGMFTCIWNKTADSADVQHFVSLGDSLRDAAKTSGQLRFALDDYFIRQVFAKKDGGFLLTAEDYSYQRTGISNSWNRWDYLNNYYYSPYYGSSYYYYNPYTGYYRPYNSYGNQSTRYFYANIVVLSYDKSGNLQWSRVINKDQFDDDNDNFLSFSTFNSGGEIHFLFNEDKNRNQIIANHSINGSGQITRNPTLKSQERGYRFMPKLSKQVGAGQLIIPCEYRGYICFARIDL
ncbi:MAG: hypothetical protein U0V75_15255 [Ferruginibacter sp.]